MFFYNCHGCSGKLMPAHIILGGKQTLVSFCVQCGAINAELPMERYRYLVKGWADKDQIERAEKERTAQWFFVKLTDGSKTMYHGVRDAATDTLIQSG